LTPQEQEQREYFLLMALNKNLKSLRTFTEEIITKLYQPNLLLFENTNFISNRTKDSLNLIRLLGAIECLAVEQRSTDSFNKGLEVNSVNVLKVKELSKQLLASTVKIVHLEYLLGRGKGWLWKGKRISIHQLEAFLVWYLYNKITI